MRGAAVRRFRAWLLLAAFVETLGLTGFSADHLGLIDIACGAVGVAPAGQPTQVGPAAPGDVQHCPVCHFMRAVSGAHSTDIVRLTAPAERAVPAVAAVAASPTVEPVTRSSRGPPCVTSPTVS